MSTIAPQADAVQDDLRPEYDEATLTQMLASGVRGKYAPQAAQVRTVTLEPDVAAAFPDAAAVNNALRSLIAPHTDTAPQK